MCVSSQPGHQLHPGHREVLALESFKGDHPISKTFHVVTNQPAIRESSCYSGGDAQKWVGFSKYLSKRQCDGGGTGQEGKGRSKLSGTVGAGATMLVEGSLVL